MSYGEASAAAVRESCSSRWSSLAAASRRSKRIDVHQSQPRQLWRSFDKVLGRGKNLLSSDIDASALHQFFDDKVAGVRAATAHADEPRFTPVPVGCELRLYSSHTE